MINPIGCLLGIVLIAVLCLHFQFWMDINHG